MSDSEKHRMIKKILGQSKDVLNMWLCVIYSEKENGKENLPSLKK